METIVPSGRSRFQHPLILGWTLCLASCGNGIEEENAKPAPLSETAGSRQFDASGALAFQHIRLRDERQPGPSTDMARLPSGQLVPLDEARRVFFSGHFQNWGVLDVDSAHDLGNVPDGERVEYLVLLSTDVDTTRRRFPGINLSALSSRYHAVLRATKKEAIAFAKSGVARRAIYPASSSGRHAGVRYSQSWISAEDSTPSSHATSGLGVAVAQGFDYHGSPSSTLESGGTLERFTNQARIGMLEGIGGEDTTAANAEGSGRGCLLDEDHEAFSRAPSIAYLNPQPYSCVTDADCATPCGAVFGRCRLNSRLSASVCIDSHATGVASRMVAAIEPAIGYFEWLSISGVPATSTFVVAMNGQSRSVSISPSMSPQNIVDSIQAQVATFPEVVSGDVTISPQSGSQGPAFELEATADGTAVDFMVSDSLDLWEAACSNVISPAYCSYSSVSPGGDYMASRAKLYVANNAVLQNGKIETPITRIDHAYDWFSRAGVKIVNESWEQSNSRARGELQDYYAREGIVNRVDGPLPPAFGRTRLLFVNAAGNRLQPERGCSGNDCRTLCPSQNGLCVGAVELSTANPPAYAPDDLSGLRLAPISRWQNNLEVEFEMPDLVAEGGVGAQNADQFNPSTISRYGGRSWSDVDQGTSLAAPVVSALLSLRFNCGPFDPLMAIAELHAYTTRERHAADIERLLDSSGGFLYEETCGAHPWGVTRYPLPQFCDHKAGAGVARFDDLSDALFARARVDCVRLTSTPNDPGDPNDPSEGDPPFESSGPVAEIAPTDPRWQSVSGSAATYEPQSGIARSSFALRGPGSKSMAHIGTIRGTVPAGGGALERLRMALIYSEVGASQSDILAGLAGPRTQFEPYVNVDLGVRGTLLSTGQPAWLFVSESLHSTREGFDVERFDEFDLSQDFDVYMIVPTAYTTSGLPPVRYVWAAYQERS